MLTLLRVRRGARLRRRPELDGASRPLRSAGSWQPSFCECEAGALPFSRGLPAGLINKTYYSSMRYGFSNAARQMAIVRVRIMSEKPVETEGAPVDGSARKIPLSERVRQAHG
jgi:hypothetical protein